MKREYIFLFVGLALIWILGYLLFMPTNKPKSAISDEGQATTVNK